MRSSLLHRLVKLIQPFLIHLGFHYVSWVGHSTRWRVEGESHYFLERSRGDRPLIFAFWHNQLMLMPFGYKALVRHKKLTVLISQSRDGAIVDQFVKKFGFESIRGSSSRGGTHALIRLKRQIEEGYDLAITPDGPRGPRFQVARGAIALASVSGCPILPVACDFKYKKRLSTWDQFKIPRPYNIASLVVGQAMKVDPNGDESHFEAKREELQERLEEVNRRAEEEVWK